MRSVPWAWRVLRLRDASGSDVELVPRPAQERSPAAVRLLQILAFCSPDRSPCPCFTGRADRALLPLDGALRDKLMLGQVIRDIARLALVRVDQASRTLQIHRLVQAVIRSQMTTQQQLDARHTVHRMLAGACRSWEEPDDPPTGRPIDNGLAAPHLVPGRGCDDGRTRELLLDWCTTSDTRRNSSPGLTLPAAWSACGPPAGPNDSRYCAFKAEIADVLRTRGASPKPGRL